MVLGLPLQLIGHGVAAARVVYTVLEPYRPASTFCAESYPSESSAWSRCFETVFRHPLDSVSWPILLFPLPGLILSSIGGWLLIRSAVGHSRRERLAWQVLITAMTLHLQGWLLLWLYFSLSSAEPRWVALVAVSAGLLAVTLVVRARVAARVRGEGPKVWRLLLADSAIASVASAATIGVALHRLVGVGGVLFFLASPAGASTALAVLLGVAAAVATRKDKSSRRGE